MPKPEVELRNWNDLPVDSLRVYKWRRFDVAATRAGRDINEKAKTACWKVRRHDYDVIGSRDVIGEVTIQKPLTTFL